jgi:hypothetical protein
MIITTEQILINEHIELFNDIDMLTECITFVRDKQGRPDAIAGKHDDLLFSDMIAEAARPQQKVYVEIDEEAQRRKDERAYRAQKDIEEIGYELPDKGYFQW